MSIRFIEWDILSDWERYLETNLCYLREMGDAEMVEYVLSEDYLPDITYAHTRTVRPCKAYRIEEDGVFVGFYVVRLEEHQTYFADFYVKPAYRNHGIGTAVISHLQNQFDNIYLTPSEKAIPLYERTGFCKTEEIYEDNGHHIYRWTKPCKTFDVCALGELLIDFTENGSSPQGNPMLEANPGGAPCNVLAMLQNLGKKTAFIGKVGNDSFGKMLHDAVKTTGIDTSNLLFDDKVHTTLAFVHTQPDGDRAFSFYRNPGADMMLTKEEVNPSLIASARIFHFGTLSSTHDGVKEATRYAIQIAKHSGAWISFDPNLREMLWDDLSRAKEEIAYGLSQCDILKISDNELEFMTGTADIDKAVSLLRAQYDIPVIFATLGKNGSKAYYKDIAVSCGGFLVPTIETTGAGDTFCAAALSKLLDNGSFAMDEKGYSELLRFANAAAAIVTTRKGALKAMPTIDEINTLL